MYKSSHSNERLRVSDLDYTKTLLLRSQVNRAFISASRAREGDREGERGPYGEADWTPIRYINRAYSHTTLAGLYRAARVGLVTPLRDGMNLVAKEYVAAQNPDDPGVLVLSRFAGAAHECKAALLVNPYDPDSVAAAIGQALSMPLAERRERHDSLFLVLSHNDIQYWADRFLTALERLPMPLSRLEQMSSVGS